MPDYDVFNGDADGICALHQLRLQEPRDATLITGAKRDIALMGQVAAALAGRPDAATSRIRVLDISMARNRDALVTVLHAGAHVTWIDHHDAGIVPDHPRLQASIDTDPAVCTAVLVDRALAGRHRRWAVCAAFGDGLPATALALAGRLPAEVALSATALAALRRMGEALNYNAYAADTGTAVQTAQAIYGSLDGVTDPLSVADWPLFATLAQLSQDDLAESLRGGPVLDLPKAAAWILPATLAARRARGLIAQRLRAAHPDRAILIVAPDGRGRADISIRCGGEPGRTAAGLAARFDGGGGRAGAAGIDRIAMERVDEVLATFQAWYCDPVPPLSPREAGDPRDPPVEDKETS